ncbi:class A sortase [Enterococcus gilvus]|uniref:class A sortase n=1 Tax=Enterococcus gilvus TaxID=160453 RepID=UPI0028D56536|nr:class A sortase [Enterococcus gilvus]
MWKHWRLFLGRLIVLVELFYGGTQLYDLYEDHQFQEGLEIAQKAPIVAHPQNFTDNRPTADNNVSVNTLVSYQQEAQKQGMEKQVAGHLKLPKIKQDLPILRGANAYTLSLGAATFFYDDAVMGKGNVVLAGHDMLVPGVLFSDLKDLGKGDAMDLIGQSTSYRYRVDRQFIVPETFTLTNGKPAPDSFLSLPAKGERPKLTLFTCTYTKQGKERYVVQGHLIETFPNKNE